MMPHENSNKKEPFFRTKPSVKEEIQKKIEVEKPHIVYKNLVCENVEGHDVVSKPRNVRQLHNAKATKQEEIRLYHCSVFSYHCSVFCTTVPFFPQRNSVFLYHCSVFCTTVPFFSTTEQKRKGVCASLFCVFVTLFRFLHHRSVFFPQHNKKRNSVFVLLFNVFVPLFRFLHFCSVFPQRYKKRTVCFCITVLCFRTTVPFFHGGQRNKKRNIVFLHFCSVFSTRDNGTKTEQQMETEHPNERE